MEQISKQAGVSVGTYYYYFESKFDLFSEIYKRADDYFINEVAGKLKAEDSKGKIVEYFQKYAEYNYADGIDMVKSCIPRIIKCLLQRGVTCRMCFVQL